MFNSTTSCPINPEIHNNRYLIAEFENFIPQIRQTIANNLDRRLARRIGVSDVVQETFLEAMKRFDGYLTAKPMQIRDWLCLLAKNMARNANTFHLRTMKRSLRLERRDQPIDSQRKATQSSPSANCVLNEMLDRKVHLLNQLSNTDREILRLRHELCRSNQQAAKALGISEKAASKRYLRAVTNLKQKMEVLS